MLGKPFACRTVAGRTCCAPETTHLVIKARGGTDFPELATSCAEWILEDSNSAAILRDQTQLLSLSSLGTRTTEMAPDTARRPSDPGAPGPWNEHGGALRGEGGTGGLMAESSRKAQAGWHSTVRASYPLLLAQLGSPGAFLPWIFREISVPGGDRTTDGRKSPCSCSGLLRSGVKRSWAALRRGKPCPHDGAKALSITCESPGGACSQGWHALHLGLLRAGWLPWRLQWNPLKAGTHTPGLQ